MSCKGDIKFRFTQSPSGIISGIAFEEEGGIVASFKLVVRRDSVYVHGKSWNSVTLIMVSGAMGRKAYDIFDEVLSKYGERSEMPNRRIGRIRSGWKIRDDRVKEAIVEVKRALEKRK